MATSELSSPLRVAASNVGGIDQTDVEFRPGITVLVGRNATNRTSFLQAIMAGLGSRNVSLKGDADEGRVELTVDGETYTRTLTRTANGVQFGGDPYLDDPEVADLFSFLLEDNEARQAIARGDDLRDLIMRPVDTAEIKANINLLERERESVDEQLADIESAKSRLPDLERRRADLEDEISEVREDLEAAQEALEAADASVEETREEEDELDEALDALSETRAELDEVRDRIETQRESLASVREERAELDAPEEGDALDDIESVEAEIDDLRERKRTLDSAVNRLQTLVQVTQQLVSGEETALLDILQSAGDAGGHVAGSVDADGDSENGDGGVEDVTAGLLPDEEVEAVTCWTCGSEVERGELEESLDRLRTVLQETRTERADLDEELSERQDELSDLRDERRERERQRERRRRLAEEVEDREAAIADLQERRGELESEIERLESEVDALESDVYSDLLDRHREANELEFELGRLRDDLDDVEAEISEVEERADREDDLRERREEITDELTELRTRIDHLEETAVDAFNEHMAELLGVLGYDNLERVWIERTGATNTEFALHVVRSTDDGVAYEDTVDHLSESERNVVGLVFALAGYLVHDVHETVPVMLLDSLEAIDSDRIAAVVEYFEAYAPSLVVALLPEDARAVDDDYERITDI
ncbi:archaea-specific SMC-related protein [Halocalculus aciditolerans]|uniref:Chromosome segregation protein SMC n=1 Tax=Halocalculus aciditolerans TaxID=1383812 RepID=A0A830F5G1_9EURY|nr:archaea-specific SMC-related protein [Halocalculus aciditolerans]GGL64777.1 chromosome segregation protein SMC [Halocalculus aciditolerans]